MLHETDPTKLNPIEFNLTRPIRIAIMVSLITGFFVISPILIFYTAGFRYDWAQKKIQPTGVISIDATPKNMQVSINGVTIKNSFPIWLPNRAPGTYMVMLTSPGYHSWNKEISVVSNQTAFIKNVSLFKQSQPQLVLSPTSTSITQVMSTGDVPGYLTVNRYPDHYEVVYVNSLDNQTSTVATSTTSTVPVLSLAPAHDNLAIWTSNGKNKLVTLLALNDPIHLTTFTYPLNSTITYHWAGTSSQAPLYVVNNKALERLAIGQARYVIGELTEPIWFAQADDDRWIYSSSTLSHIVKKNVTESYSVPGSVDEIIDASAQRVILHGSDGVRIVRLQTSPTEIQFLPTTQLYFQTGTQEWWSWSDWEVWSIYASGKAALLNRSGSKMNSLRPLDNFGLMLIASDAALSGFNPGYFLTEELSRVDSVTSVDTSIKLRRIYFTGRVNGVAGVYELEY